MVLAAMFGLVVARSVTDPLSRLTSEVKRLAKGDTNLKFADTARKDEIGEISRALETVRESIVEMGRSKSSPQTQMFAGLGIDYALNSALDNSAACSSTSAAACFAPWNSSPASSCRPGAMCPRKCPRPDAFKNVKGLILPDQGLIGLTSRLPSFCHPVLRRTMAPEAGTEGGAGRKPDGRQQRTGCVIRPEHRTASSAITPHHADLQGRRRRRPRLAGGKQTDRRSLAMRSDASAAKAETRGRGEGCGDLGQGRRSGDGRIGSGS